MLKKGDIVSGKVLEVSYPNRGTVEGPEGERILVKNVIPGQTVKVQIYKKKGERLFGNFLETVKKSPVEGDALCPSHPECGGCLYQTLPYGEQLKIKEDQIIKLMSEVTDPDTVYDGIVESPLKTRYRNKMEFSFGDEYKGGPLNLGLHRRSAMYDILDASRCFLVHKDINLITECVINYCRKHELPYYHKSRHDGFLRHLLVRRAEKTGEIMVLLVTSSEKDHDFMELKDDLLCLPLEGEITGFIHGINDKYADMVQVGEERVLFGRDHIYDETAGLKFKISMFSFFQTNTSGADELYGRVKEYVKTAYPDMNTQDTTIFDLYCGTGTIGQILSDTASQVYGIELVEEAVEAANENAAFNGISNCRFIAGDVGKVLNELNIKPDVVVLDPPREGIVPKTLEKIKKFDIDKMIYISCKASSFVENMKELSKEGWRVERFSVVDLFPMTCHVETVVLLSDKKVDGHINIDLDVEKLEDKSVASK